VKSNIIYVVGGTDGVNRFNTVESYNPATNTWTTKAPLLLGKSEASVGLVGTTIVAADGYTSSMDTGDNEGYNSSTNGWSTLTSDPTPRHEACTGSTGTTLYLAGGSNNSGTSLSLTESFSVTSNKWTTLTSMPLAVTFPGSAIDTGLLYCFGGSDRNSQFQGKVYNYVQIYQP
jgi:N-acetylneuraminic acid mutarotase